MPVSAGEVAAKLRFQVVSDKLVEAKKNLDDTRMSFVQAGGAATEAGQAIYKSMAEAQASVEALTIKTMAARDAMRGMTSDYTNRINRATDSAFGLNTPAAAPQQMIGANLPPVGQPAFGGVVQTNVPGGGGGGGSRRRVILTPPPGGGGGGVGGGGGDDEEKLSMVDALATRMVTRLAIFYALRMSYDFIKDLFAAAAAMKELSDQTDISIAKLGGMEQVAERLDIKVGTVASGIEGFQKNLSQMSPKVVDTLAQIGQPIEKLFAMNPEQRLDTVWRSIGKISDQAERNRVEMNLLGTTGLDPLIRKYDEVTEAANKFNSSATLGLANTVSAFKTLGQGAKEVMNSFLDEAQRGAAIMFQGLFNFGGAGRNNPDFMNSIFGNTTGMTEAGGAGGADKPLMGQAFIDQLLKENKGAGVRGQHRDFLNQLRENGMLTEANAARAGVTTPELKSYQQEMELMTRIFTVRERLIKLTEEEGVLNRQKADSLDKLNRMESDLSDADLKLYESTSKLNEARSNIQDLEAEKKAYYELAESVKTAGMSKKELEKINDDYAIKAVEIDKKIIQDQIKINQLLEDQTRISREAKRERLAGEGTRLEGGPLDKDIDPALAAERRYEETVDRIKKARAAGTIKTDEDADEQIQAAQRRFFRDIQEAGEAMKQAGKDANMMGQGALEGAKGSLGLADATDAASSKMVGGSVRGGAGGKITDPRLRGLMTSGYTVNEAMAIVGGYGGQGIMEANVRRSASERAAIIEQNNTILMEGLLLSGDASGRAALREHVSKAMEESVKQGQKFSSAS